MGVVIGIALGSEHNVGINGRSTGINWWKVHSLIARVLVWERD